MHPDDADRMANSVDPDQEQSDTVFPDLSENLWSFLYTDNNLLKVFYMSAESRVENTNPVPGSGIKTFHMTLQCQIRQSSVTDISWQMKFDELI